MVGRWRVIDVTQRAAAAWKSRMQRTFFMPYSGWTSCSSFFHSLAISPSDPALFSFPCVLLLSPTFSNIYFAHPSFSLYILRPYPFVIFLFSSKFYLCCHLQRTEASPSGNSHSFVQNDNYLQLPMPYLDTISLTCELTGKSSSSGLLIFISVFTLFGPELLFSKSPSLFFFPSS